MAISKITLNGQTQMDVTQKTVTAESMLNGATSLKNDGTDIIGSIQYQAATTITPTKQSQTAVDSGKYTTGAVMVAAIPAAYQDVTGVTATATDVRDGVSFVDSSGNLVAGTIAVIGTSKIGTATAG